MHVMTGRTHELAVWHDPKSSKRVVVNDSMQHGYVYFRTQPAGRNFAPGFTPELTPGDMLRLGVFGGKYMTDCRAEFPASWFARAKLSPQRRDPRLNYFGVNASQSLAVWRRNGWIRPQDPRGWFQWYCRVLHGPADGRRCAANQKMARHPAARVSHTEELQGRRPGLPAEAAAGRAALGVQTRARF